MVDGDDDDVAAMREIGAVVSGEEPEPVAKPPPWHQNITGRLRAVLDRGCPDVQDEAVFALARAECGAICGALGPYSSASRTPVHVAGFDRRHEAVFARGRSAVGNAFEDLDAVTSVPRTLPDAVSAITAGVSAPFSEVRREPEQERFGDS